VKQPEHEPLSKAQPEFTFEQIEGLRRGLRIGEDIAGHKTTATIDNGPIVPDHLLAKYQSGNRHQRRAMWAQLRRAQKKAAR
jgi:hypothetical protein